jgi:site-specific recombinase XerC
VVGGVVRERVIITQSKTGHPVQIEVGDLARKAISAWCARPEMTGSPFLFPSRFHGVPHISNLQYARIVHRWVTSIGLEPSAYGTHSMRRTKAALFYRKTGNLRAVQLLLGHTRSLNVEIRPVYHLRHGHDQGPAPAVSGPKPFRRRRCS